MLECDEEYIGKSVRTYGERLKEYFRAPSPIYNHANTSGHYIPGWLISPLWVGSHTTILGPSRMLCI